MEVADVHRVAARKWWNLARETMPSETVGQSAERRTDSAARCALRRMWASETACLDFPQNTPPPLKKNAE